MKRMMLILSALLASQVWMSGYSFGATACGQAVAPTLGQETTSTPAAPSEEEFREFLKSAKVVAGEQTSKGITTPYMLTLSDGQRTMKAGFQSVDIFRPRKEFSPSLIRLEFRDSYKFNIAAYQVAKLLGLQDMVPTTVEYTWNGKAGSLTWWVPVKWDEEDGLQAKAQPPDPDAWSKQESKMWVFSQLIYDADRNQTNILITGDWKLWMIDFSRTFRLETDLKEAEKLTRCDRQLLQRLRQLDETQILEKTKPYLTKKEVKPLLTRRNLIVKHFEGLIAQKGEGNVIF